MFRAETKVKFLSALFSSFILCLTNYLVFVTNYPISWQLFMDIIFGYPLIGQFDTIWQAEKTYCLTYAWYFTFIQ